LAIAPGGPYAGDLFVGDNNNRRIQFFDPSGEFVGAFGSNVLASGPDAAGGNLCLAGLGDVCKGGGEEKFRGTGNTYGFSHAIAPSGSAEGDPPIRFAIGPTGAVYVADYWWLQKYSPDLTTEHDFAEGLCSKEPAPEFCRDVAVDPNSGDVYVAYGIPGQEEVELPGGGTFSRTVLKEMGIARYDAAGDEPPVETSLESSEVGSIGGMAIDGSTGNERSGRVYFSTESPEQRVDVLGEPTPPDIEFDKVNPEKLQPHSATLSATINPNGNKIHTLYRFETLVQGGVWTQYPVPNTDIGNGTTPQAIETTVPDLLANTEYHVRLTVFKGQRYTTPEQTFTTPPAAPDVETGGAQWSGPAGSGPSLTFSGQIDGNNLPLHYYFEYGADAAYGNRVPGFETGSHPASQQPFAARQTVAGLDPNSAYHYRLVARGPSGTTVGADREVQPPESGQRYPELVSPVEKGSGKVGAYVFGDGQVFWQAAENGERVAYAIEGGEPGASGGGEVMNLGGRDASLGWRNSQLTPPSIVPASETDVQGANPGFVRWSSPDMSCGFTESRQPLTPAVSEFEVEHDAMNLFRHDYVTGAYTDLTTLHLNEPNEGVARGYRIGGASADCGRVVFETRNRLLASVPAGESEHLYEWEDAGGPGGTLRSADVLPDESIPAGDAVFGDSISSINAVSRPDAARVFFSANGALFVRKNHAVTVKYSESKTATPTNAPTYGKASGDGSHVFFTANYGIAANGKSGGSGTCCDLYDYDVENGSLTDLTPDANPADKQGAAVSGVLGTSDDGSYVYFAAKGQLIPGEGRTFTQNSAGAEFNNVYLAHEGTLSFVGMISEYGGVEEDIFGIEGSYYTSRVTPDGRYLLFISKLNLTNYDSEGVRELYRYSAPEAAVECVSCRSDELPPHGAGARMIPATIPGIDNYHARMISDDGSRVFFNSEDVLTPGSLEKTGLFQRNVYEWHNGTVHLLAAPGEIVDISSDGRDAFVATPQALVPQDQDSQPDLYDLRIDGGFPYAPSEPCDPLAENSCQGTPPLPPPPTPDPASARATGPGNPPVSAAHRKSKKHHKKKHKSRKRASGGNRGGAR
jgi:hypothetical protein